MSEAYDRLQAEAEELYPDLSEGVLRAAHVNAKTVNAEQVEAAAEGLAVQDKRLWEVMGEVTREQYREFARAAFRSAGFLIGGDDDE